MSTRAPSGSSARLVCATHQITTYPYTVGFWARVDATGIEQTAFGLSDTGVANQYNRIAATLGGFWNIGAMAGGAFTGANAGTVTAGVWYFIVGRFITSSSRRLCVFNSRVGSIDHGSGTAPRNFPTSADIISLHMLELSTPAENFVGNIAEFWYTNTDIQPDGLQLQNSTMRQLATQGPFSLPHINKDIIEYRSFRQGLDSRSDNPGEVYSRGLRQVWTNTNGVTLGPHPPAADNWAKPDGSTFYLPNYFFDSGTPPANDYYSLMMMGYGI